MRIIAPLLLVALAASAEGAALVRVINTVPSRNSDAAIQSGTDAGYIVTPAWTIDRVGLQYFPDVDGALSTSPTFVQTEFVSPIGTAEGAATNNFAWSYALPPLRQYHLPVTAAANAVVTRTDRITAYKNTQITVGATAKYPAGYDNYAQDSLKADGLPGYLSFSAGTYRFQPYAIFGDATAPAGTPAALSNAARPFPGGLKSITFVDGRVYTLVIIGDGKWTVNQPSVAFGADFAIQVIEESTAPTTFGMASLRWFHAVRTLRSDTISVLLGESSTARTLASGIAFGGVSDYVDVTPNSAQIFPVSADSTKTLVAPNTADKFEVTHDVRAGLRATAICSIASEVDLRPFCRMVPSRVVAYVRLVNDLAGFNSFSVGAGGSVPFSRVKLDLFATSEMPDPAVITEASQFGGSVGTSNNHILNVRGLYKVLSGVAAGACSGYSEVYVPLPITDFAVRWTVVRDDASAISNVATINTQPAASSAGLQNSNIFKPTRSAFTTVPAAGDQVSEWFLGGVFHKRVHLVVRTDGGVTLSGVNNAAVRAPFRFRPTGGAADWIDTTVSTDIFVEPGSYYSFAVTPTTPTAAFLTSATETNPASNAISILGHLDYNVDDISNGVAAGRAAVSLGTIRSARTYQGANAAANAAPLPADAISQSFAGNTLNARPKNGGSVSTYTFAAELAAANFPQVNQAGAAVAAGAALVNGVAGQFIDLSTRNLRFENDDYFWTDSLTSNGPFFSLPAGAYAVDQTLAATSVASCLNSIPTTDLTVAAGDRVYLYVLNVFGCRTNNNDLTRLSTIACKAQSASSTGNDGNTVINPTPISAPAGPTFFFAAAPALSVSVSMVVALIFAVVAVLF